MARVSTVRGDIDSAALGATLMHEHVFVLSPEINQNYPETWGDENSRVEDAVRQLRLLKSGGIDSIVDMTVLGLGRYLPRIRRIADRVDLHILVATGMMACGELPAFFRSRRAWSRTRPPRDLVDMFVGDIRAGIGGTGIRAAVVKCATDSRGLTPAAECVLRAAARQKMIAEGQDELGFGGGRPRREALPIRSSRAQHLWEALAAGYRVLGFDKACGGDVVFEQLVLARLIEPTSKLDSIRVLEEMGIPAPAYRTLKRRLGDYARPTWRRQLAAACAQSMHVTPAPGREGPRRRPKRVRTPRPRPRRR
mgnify:CR=1 FL=1